MKDVVKIVFEYSEGYFLAYRPIIRISINKEKIEYYVANDAYKLKLVYSKKINDTIFSKLLSLSDSAFDVHYQVLGRKSWTRIALLDEDESYNENYVSFNFTLLQLDELRDYLLDLLDHKYIPPFLE